MIARYKIHKNKPKNYTNDYIIDKNVLKHNINSSTRIRIWDKRSEITRKRF